MDSAKKIVDDYVVGKIPDFETFKKRVDELKNINQTIENTGKSFLVELGRSIKPNDKQYIDYVIQKGADVNAKDNEGMTPLMLVLSKEHMYHNPTLLTSLLNSNNIDLNAVDSKGHNAIDYADPSDKYIEYVKQAASKRGVKLNPYSFPPRSHDYYIKDAFNKGQAHGERGMSTDKNILNKMGESIPADEMVKSYMKGYSTAREKLSKMAGTSRSRKRKSKSKKSKKTRKH